MALDEKQRQKKQARKQANRRAKLAEQKLKSVGGGGYFPLLAARFPIHECRVPEDWFDTSILATTKIH
jgi:hypothetical protein